MEYFKGAPSCLKWCWEGIDAVLSAVKQSHWFAVHVISCRLWCHSISPCCRAVRSDIIAVCIVRRYDACRGSIDPAWIAVRILWIPLSIFSIFSPSIWMIHKINFPLRAGFDHKCKNISRYRSSITNAFHVLSGHGKKKMLLPLTSH